MGTESREAISASSTASAEAGGIARQQRSGHKLIGPILIDWLREVPLIPVLLVAVIAGVIFNDTFFTATNISNVLAQSSVLAVLVVGQTLLLVAGRMDISQESVVSLAPLLAAWLMVGTIAGGTGFGLNPYLAILLTLAVGAIVGLANGLLVVKVRLNPFITTLATLILLAGLASAVARGNSFFGIPDPYLYLGSAKWLGLNASVWMAGFLYLIVGFFLRYHRIGRAVYAIGGNEKAAFAAGINVSRIVTGLFVLSGLLAAFGGLLLAGRLASATAEAGSNLIFSVLAACVIGGVSLNGGRGRLVGALTGVLLLGVINNLLVLSNVEPYWINAVYGVIIILALVLAHVTGREGD